MGKIAEQLEKIINEAHFQWLEKNTKHTNIISHYSEAIEKYILDRKPKKKDKNFYETDIRYNQALKEWQDNLEKNEK